MDENLEISFNSKEKSKKLQQDAFLKLAPVDRFLYFIQSVKESQSLYNLKQKDTSNNFILSK